MMTDYWTTGVLFVAILFAGLLVGTKVCDWIEGRNQRGEREKAWQARQYPYLQVRRRRRNTLRRKA